MKASTLILTTVFLISGHLFGQTFTRITTGAIVNDGGESWASIWGDYNNDGYIDLFVANGTEEAFGPEHNNFLYRNNGGETFTKMVLDPITSDGG